MSCFLHVIFLSTFLSPFNTSSFNYLFLPQIYFTLLLFSFPVVSEEAVPHPMFFVLLYLFFLSSPKDIFKLLLERGEERKEHQCERETSIGVREKHRLVPFLYVP